MVHEEFAEHGRTSCVLLFHWQDESHLYLLSLLLSDLEGENRFSGKELQGKDR